jgi:hypothetical protein
VNPELRNFDSRRLITTSSLTFLSLPRIPSLEDFSLQACALEEGGWGKAAGGRQSASRHAFFAPPKGQRALFRRGRSDRGSWLGLESGGPRANNPARGDGRNARVGKVVRAKKPAGGRKPCHSVSCLTLTCVRVGPRGSRRTESGDVTSPADTLPAGISRKGPKAMCGCEGRGENCSGHFPVRPGLFCGTRVPDRSPWETYCNVTLR